MSLNVFRKGLDRILKEPLSRKIELLVFALLIIVIVSLPVFFGTKTYPIAVVSGTSMYPSLQNGDMVIFKSVDTRSIPNGTIIVFVQSNTGVSALDALLKPIIIHRVVGSFLQADGTVYYVTKGDNNNFNDPSAVSANHVLGIPVQVIPKAGLILLFFSAPQGMVALIGFITLIYLGYYEGKLDDDKKRETFLGAVASMVINGELPEEAFKRFELAVKYVNREELEQIKEGLTRSLLDWLNKSAKEKDWTIHNTICPVCGEEVRSYEGSDKVPFIVCPRCIWKRGKIAVIQPEVVTVP